MKFNPILLLPVILPILIPSQIVAAQKTAVVPKTSESSNPQSTLIAQQNRSRRIQFAPRSSSASVEDSVVRGTRDIYQLRARKGQRMVVNITSIENNAVFDIKSPTGRIIKQEATNFSTALPATGDYQIIVGGTRGNASYKLTVSIK